MARTAVVAGTATAVSNRVSRRQAERWSAQEQPYYEQPPAAAPAPAPPAGESRVEQLKELAALKEQGALTEEEFAAEKARILAS
jgi:putative oligomerization/nucleic acid binding protein